MPIRFRCRHCTRLLGIARRKAGTAIRCPQCGELLTVPVTDPPAGMIVPSAMFVMAENTASGGLDLVRVSGAPPSFVTVKLSDFVAPMATLP